MRVIMRANGNRRPVIVGAGLVGSLIGRIAWRGLSREAFPGTSRNLQGSHGGDVGMCRNELVREVSADRFHVECLAVGF